MNFDVPNAEGVSGDPWPAVLHFLGAPRRRNAGGVAKMQVIAALASLDPAGSPMCLHCSGCAGLADPRACLCSSCANLIVFNPGILRCSLNLDARSAPMQAR